MIDPADQTASPTRAHGHQARTRVFRPLLVTPRCLAGAVGLAFEGSGIILGEIDGPRICQTPLPLAEGIAALATASGDACCLPATKETA